MYIIVGAEMEGRAEPLTIRSPTRSPASTAQRKLGAQVYIRVPYIEGPYGLYMNISTKYSFKKGSLRERSIERERARNEVNEILCMRYMCLAV